MNKKLYYGIVIICIILISSNIYNGYAYNLEKRSKSYSLGVPDYAEGIVYEAEITAYDKEEWRDHIGYFSEPDEIFAGTENDADVVGARSKTKVLDWGRKKDNIPFFADFVLRARVENEDIPTAENLYDVCDYITNSINNLSDASSPTPIITGLEEAFVMLEVLGGFNLHPGGESDDMWPAWQNATFVNASFAAYNFDVDYINSIYNKLIDGYNLHREFWYWTSKDFKKNPDVKRFDVPFIKDPEDWYNTYEVLEAFKADLLGGALELIDSLMALNDSINALKTINPGNYTTLQNVILLGLVLPPPLGQGLPSPPARWLNQLHWLLIDAATNETGQNWLQQQSGGAKGLYAVIEGLGYEIPGKFGFLWQLLIEGLPTLTPVDEYLKDVVKAFDIDGRAIETGIRGLDPATPIIGDVWVEENTIILEFEYANPNEKRDGWKVEFTYDDHGIQKSVIFSGSEIFYEQVVHPSSLEQRILPVIIGVFAITTFSIIVLVAVYIRHKLKKKKVKEVRKKYGIEKIISES